MVSAPGSAGNDASGKHFSVSPPSSYMYAMFFDAHSTETSIISSPNIPKESALMCSLAAELLAGHKNAMVASRVLPPPSPFSTTITFAPASNAAIAATAPAPPQPKITTSVSSSQRMSSTVIGSSSVRYRQDSTLFLVVFDNSLEKPLSLELVNHTFIEEASELKFRLSLACLLLDLF